MSLVRQTSHKPLFFLKQCTCMSKIKPKMQLKFMGTSDITVRRLGIFNTPFWKLNEIYLPPMVAFIYFKRLSDFNGRYYSICQTAKWVIMIAVKSIKWARAKNLWWPLDVRSPEAWGRAFFRRTAAMYGGNYTRSIAWSPFFLAKVIISDKNIK